MSVSGWRNTVPRFHLLHVTEADYFGNGTAITRSLDKIQRDTQTRAIDMICYKMWEIK
jgi:hypothetical protein